VWGPGGEVLAGDDSGAGDGTGAGDGSGAGDGTGAGDGRAVALGDEVLGRVSGTGAPALAAALGALASVESERRATADEVLELYRRSTSSPSWARRWRRRPIGRS
jgi:hypothetical protein